MSEDEDEPSTPPLPPRRPHLQRPPPHPIDISFKPEARRHSAVRDSLYHVQRALVSPRVLYAVAAISGWAWAGAQYVAGSARQSDLDKAARDITALETQLEQVTVTANTALSGAQECVKQLGAQALATRAIVGQIARQRGRTEHQKRNEQAAAESRYSTAITDGKPPHEAARIALFDQ